jgi:mannose-1-phosphate guanylyltransferase/mannose-6-phosphate isomerase
VQRHGPEDGNGGADHSNIRTLHAAGWTAQGDATNPADEAFTERRPWGRFEQLVSNTEVTVKIITVEPRQRLSLQRHSHRGELWQVLDTPMDVTVADSSWTAPAGDTVWVPCGAVHRLSNPGPLPGRILEIAFGQFDESDIERLADDYARQ